MARKEVTSDDIRLDEPVINIANPDDPIKDVESVSGAELEKTASNESFYNDRITVFFAEPATESESPYVEATVNGRYFCAKRGSEAVVPRYILEVIARSKTMRVKTERRVAKDGSEEVVPVTLTTPCYPMSVLHDPAGAKGTNWFKSILAQPA